MLVQILKIATIVHDASEANTKLYNMVSMGFYIKSSDEYLLDLEIPATERIQFSLLKLFEYGCVLQHHRVT
jgi:hypothetical protein